MNCKKPYEYALKNITKRLLSNRYEDAEWNTTELEPVGGTYQAHIQLTFTCGLIYRFTLKVFESGSVIVAVTLKKGISVSGSEPVMTDIALQNDMLIDRICECFEYIRMNHKVGHGVTL